MRGPPAYLQEMVRSDMRRNLYRGIASGYAFSAVFALIAVGANAVGLVDHAGGILAVIGLKVLTNSLAWLALRLDRAVLTTQFLNTNADLLAMTVAIYLTGGPLSPLLAVYVIVLAVLGLLANMGVTLLAAGLAYAMFVIMALLTYFGALPFVPPPLSESTTLNGTQLLVALGYAGFVLGVTGFMTSRLADHLRRRSARLEAQTDELMRAREARTQLLSNVTHELRTPLHGILGTLELFELGVYGETSPEGKEAHAQLRSAAEALRRRIDDLMELTRAEAGKLELRPEPVDVGELCTNLEGALAWMLESKDVHFEVERASSLRSLVTDRAKLQQVLVHLVQNAIKFTPEGGHVTLRVREEAEAVLFEVEDTGVGISADQREAIFAAFYQVDGTDERDVAGIGLGLAIVRRLVRLLGAELELESELGRGTSLCLRVPRTPNT